MFTPSDLSDLVSADPAVAVSVFLPTHVRGSEVRQGPIRLKNLTTAAREKLVAAGIPADRAETLLAPATALVEDYRFWQHQSLSLAVFLSDAEHRVFPVPTDLAEQVVVGRGYHVVPLLPVLAADGAFRVVALTAHRSRVLLGSRFALEPEPGVELPSLEATAAESDYENPVQASPVARPNTGTISIGNAQVYGESPSEWRTRQLVELVQAIAAAVDDVSSRHPLPVVVAANAELGGHFRAATRLGPLLTKVIEVNPGSLSDEQLHDLAYPAVRPRLDASRHKTIDRFAQLSGRGDPRAVDDRDALAQAAANGQVESLLLRPAPPARERDDPRADRHTGDGTDELAGADPYGESVAHTLRFGGTVHLLGQDELPGLQRAGAILRYVAGPEAPDAPAAESGP